MNVAPLGEARIDATITARAYALRSNLRTSGFARRFDDTEIRASASGALAGIGLGWWNYALEHAYARKFRRVARTRSPQAVTSRIAPQYASMGAPPATQAEQLASHDPLTAIVAMGRAVGAQAACAGDFRVFDGRQHHRLVLAPRARGRYAGGGYEGDALVCVGADVRPSISSYEHQFIRAPVHASRGSRQQSFG